MRRWKYELTSSLRSFGSPIIHQGYRHSCVIYLWELCDFFVGTTFVDMYVKYARRVFNEMIEQDVVLSNAMIVGYTNSGHIYEALQLFQKMSPKGHCVMELMIAGYAQKVQFDESLEFFHQIPQ